MAFHQSSWQTVTERSPGVEMGITVRGLQALKAGKTLAAEGPRGSGRLEARRTSGGVVFYFRYTKPDGSRDRLALGAYDPVGRKGLTLDVATREAGKLSERYLRGDRDLRAALDREQRAAERAREAETLAADAAKAKQRATLGALVEAYVEQLRVGGKTSTRSVEKTLELHLRDAFADVWATPAADITPDDLLPVLSKLIRAKKLRQAAKVRAYLRAAYAAAISARADPQAVESLRRLRLSMNPARDLTAVAGSSRSRERVLSVAELRAYWRHIVAAEDVDGALLRFHLLTGAQRCQQLARATRANVDDDTDTLTLWDSKGRRKQPRRHVVPLIPEARSALAAIVAKPGPAAFVFSISNGLTGVTYWSLAERLAVVVKKMQDKDELGDGAFTLGDIRRTVETRLADAGVSRDVRAHLQSHGLGGVQARHYDKHSYLAEKRAALETLRDLATGKKAKVVEIASAKAKRSQGRRT